MSSFSKDTEPLGRFVAGKRRQFQLEEPLLYHSGIAGSIIVPAGFVTDFASIPRAFWRVLPPWDLHRRAAIVHDYLYSSQIWKKEVADQVFYEAMLTSGVSKSKAWTMYKAVDWFGRSAWNKHKREKANSNTPAGIGA